MTLPQHLKTKVEAEANIEPTLCAKEFVFGAEYLYQLLLSDSVDIDKEAEAVAVSYVNRIAESNTHNRHLIFLSAKHVYNEARKLSHITESVLRNEILAAYDQINSCNRVLHLRDQQIEGLQWQILEGAKYNSKLAARIKELEG